MAAVIMLIVLSISALPPDDGHAYGHEKIEYFSSGAFYVLSNGTFDTAANSADFLLQIFTVEVNWRTSNGNDSGVSVVNWLTLSDPGKKAGKDIHNGSTKTRELTGADFEPRAFRHMADGSFWVADNIRGEANFWINHFKWHV